MKNHLSCLVVISIWIFSSCTKSDNPYDFEWPVSTPSAEGLDQKKIDSAYNKAKELGFVDALIVTRNGKLVTEAYYNGYDANKPHQIWSCTKSFMSALIGIAVIFGGWVK